MCKRSECGLGPVSRREHRPLECIHTLKMVLFGWFAFQSECVHFRLWEHMWEPSMFFKQDVESQVILNQQESLCGCYSWKGSCYLETDKG